MYSKDELEQMIAEEREIGDFIFDENESCFITFVPVEYELIQVDDNTYRSGEFIYFDDYEYTIDEDKIKHFTGNLEDISEQLSVEYNEENRFMGYPVVYKNFTVKLI